ncbi:S-layer homology domain-containing protein [Paenibacillus xylanilyticus]|uniref:S-layer homology domain-containing protein n=1 Tax=Paenibacillus xylanilyticus TaxID=248903 RepID=A0A7Y6C0E5_9BACL|nr:S-layer homology domain-containing protein [Paenibacillus xylanilyticus]NUU78282.1 S-layer homology domain-containing protein [Paenibacillus xylanilyticus]
MTFKYNNPSHSKKVVSAVLAGMMALSTGGAAMAAESTEAEQSQTAAVSNTTAPAGLFSDIKVGYWAEKHVYKLANQGILLGNNGLFRPGDAVTQQEAVTMAIRFMNQEGQLNDSTAAALPTNMEVGNYFKPYVALALQLGLIDKTEESTADVSKTSWGQKPASREWITKLLIRSLNKEAEAKAQNSQSTGFADDASISEDGKGYVNLAVSLELAKGVEGNKFNPTGSVTRAQLATFFSRGEALTETAYPNTFTGYVTGLKDGQISMLVDGKAMNFAVNTSTPYFTKDSETRAAAPNVQLYTKVQVVGSAGTAAYVEVMDATPQVESVEGTFARSLSGNKIGIFVGENYETYGYDEATAFIDQNGNAIKLSDITADSIIEVQRETFSPDKKTVAIRVKSGIVNKSDSGVIAEVSTTGKTIKFTNAAGTTEQFVYGDNLIIRYQDRILSLAELKAGSAVKYTVKDSVLQTIELSQGVEQSVRGTLVEIGGNQSTLTFKREGGSLEAKLLAENPEVVINGIQDATLNDLITDATNGDQVELTLNGEDRVTKIQVIGRQMEPMNGASVVSYNSKTKVLTVLDSNKKPFVFTLDDKTKLDYNTTKPTLAGLESLLNEGRKLDLTYVGTRALSVKVIYKYEGTLSGIDTNKKTISLLSGNQTITVPYSTVPTIEIYNKSGAGLGDLKIGDKVTVTLGSNQDYVQKVSLNTVAQFEVVSVETNGRVRVKSDSLTSQFYVDQAVLTGESGQSIMTSQLTAGNLINVTFEGTTPKAVQVVKRTLAEVTSVDATSVTLKLFNGQSETVPVSGAVKVIKSGSTLTTLNSLTVGDRVEMTKDTDNSTRFRVMTIMSKQFWSYDGVGNQILVKRESTSDTNYRFALGTGVFVHQGDNTLSVQSLKDNDNIVLYLLNNVVMEIQKQ